MGFQKEGLRGNLGKNYFYRDRMDNKKNKTNPNRKKKSKKAGSQLILKKRNKSKRKINHWSIEFVQKFHYSRFIFIKTA